MSSSHRSWALFRFAVVGSLFSNPSRRGELEGRILDLSKHVWTHPVTNEPVKFGFSTIERWYHKARKANSDPLSALARRARSDRGKHFVSYQLVPELFSQYKKHSNWSYQLHYDNMVAFAQLKKLKLPPSYSTVRRFMKASGMVRYKRPGSRQNRTPGMEAATIRQAAFEKRSFEKEHVGALWHLDFHQSTTLKVLTQDGRWIRPHLLGIIDDHSRLVCHLQWYEVENSENLAHGLIQALLKRGVPRSILTDNGSAELAAEVTQALPRLGIQHDTTLPFCPNQNGKQEVFWAVVEGRLMAMLESVKDLTHERLNDVTQAWVEMEHNRKVHSEIETSPLDRYLNAPSVLRNSPTIKKCRDSFRREEQRRQRRSDGTIQLYRKRFELPSRYRHFRDVTVHFAKWDFSYVHIIDPVTEALLCRIYPIDKVKNADGRRRSLESVALPTQSDSFVEEESCEEQLPSLMRKLLEDYSSLGIPPAYLSTPKPSQPKE